MNKFLIKVNKFTFARLFKNKPNFEQTSDYTIPKVVSIKPKKQIDYDLLNSKQMKLKEELEKGPKLFTTSVEYLKKHPLPEKNIEEQVNSKFSLVPIEPERLSERVGLLGYKMGMTGAWDNFGKWFPLTVIKIDRCQVTEVKSYNNNKIFALQLGVGHRNMKKMKKPQIGHLMKNDIPPKKDFKEFKVTKENILPVGYMISPRHFVIGQYVDVRGNSKGKGSQGVMRRWNFSGNVASHGNSLNHRAAGSIGNREKPGRVWPGKKMAGKMGNEPTTARNLLVFKIDHNKSLLYLKGSVPGPIHELIEIKDAIKKRNTQYKILPFPTYIPDKDKELPSITVYQSPIDASEIYEHDNDEKLGVSDEEEEGEPEKTTEDDMAAKK